jgi:hypothetical protein
MNTSIYCFYPGSYGQDADGNALLYNIFNGTSWAGEAQVPSTNTSGTPGSVSYDGLIWCFHQGNLNNGELWYNRFDGTSWMGDTQLPSSVLSSGVSACVFFDQLYCFYSGGDGGNALLYNVFDGESWLGEQQVPLTNTSQAPSAVMYQGLLYCFHQGNLDNGELWYNVFNGIDWLGDTQIPASVLSSGPGACTYEGRLYCMYPGSYGQDSDGNALLYNVFDGTTWSGEVQVPSTNIANNPSVATLDGKLYCFHEGNLANGQLWYNVFDGTDWLGDTQLEASELSWGPGATSDLRIEGRKLIEGWKNTKVVTKSNSPLPDPSAIQFICPADSEFNWSAYKPQRGWGFTGIVNWCACSSQQGDLQVGNLFIFPGCRVTEEEANAMGIYAYESEAQINGKPAQANYRLPEQGYNNQAFTLHWQLCNMLMPADYPGGISAYALNFLGFSYTEVSLELGFNSGSLNRPYFQRINNITGQIVVEDAITVSDAWKNAITDYCNKYFVKS